MQTQIINYGSINIDHVYQVPHFVQPGETLASSSLTTVLGGKGANQSVAIARAGGVVAHIGNVNDSDQWAVQELIASGVDVSGVRLVSTPSGHAIIQVDNDGENSILLHGGANQHGNVKQLEEALETHSNAEYLLLQNECNLIDDAMQLAKRSGLSVIYNPAPMSEQTKLLPLNLVDVLVVNLGEGRALSEEQEPHKIVATLRERFGCEIVILTMGVDGTIMQTSEQHFVEATAVTTVDTTAAGDTFVGYFAAGLAAQLDPLSNLTRASRAAALAVTKLGAIPSIPKLADLRSFDGT